MSFTENMCGKKVEYLLEFCLKNFMTRSSASTRHRIENLHEEYVPSLVSNIEEIYFVKLIEIRGNKRKKLVFERYNILKFELKFFENKKYFVKNIL